MNRLGQRFPESIELSLDPVRIARIILVFGIVLQCGFVIADYFANFGDLETHKSLKQLFGITREDGLASWFASTQTLMTGLTFAIISLCIRQQNGVTRESAGWLIIAVLFVYMAIDDGVQIHERLRWMIYDIQEGSGTAVDTFPSYTWQFIFLPVYLGFGLFCFLFLWTSLEDELAPRVLMLIFASFGLAIAMDFIEGLEAEHSWNVFTWIGDNTDMDYWTLLILEEDAFETLRHFSQSLEEALEMFATTLLWFLALRHIPFIVTSIRIQISAHR